MKNKLYESAIEAAISFQKLRWAIEDAIEVEVEQDASNAINSVNKFINKKSWYDVLKLHWKQFIKQFGKFLVMAKSTTLYLMMNINSFSSQF